MIPLLVACAPATAALPFRLEEVAKIDNPTAIVEPAAGPAGLWVTEQAGRVWRLGEGAPTTVLDIRSKVDSGGEKGLLGLAFAPRFPEDPRVFVNYTYTASGQLSTRVASYRWDGTKLDPASEVEVLSFDQPWSNHNGGGLVLGPDGMLWIGVGDGGSGGDPRRTGQDPSDWYGSVLRIDVSTPPYKVPPDNPFVGRAGYAPEVWAYGIRNPWGIHFDGDTLWFADVGQDKWEEVDRGKKGGNYGWSVKEGTHCFRASPCEGDFVEPVAEYGHDEGQSVTGGVVYRGPSVPAIDGKYVYADFASGRFWALDPSGGKPTRLGDGDLNPSTFGRDRAGRLYVGDYRGRVLRVVAP